MNRHLRRPNLKAISSLALLSLLLLQAGHVKAGLVISQVYGGGGNAGATFTHDFIELLNDSASTINLSGYSVQYASAAGTTWTVTALAGSLAPGQYYLVQEAAGAGGTTALPTPDAIGTIAMSATAGKVALLSVTTALSGAISGGTGANILDFVGYGATASSFEGAGPAPAPGNTTAILRLDGGLQDTNINSADFAVGTPTPRNTQSPFANVGAVPEPSSVMLLVVGAAGLAGYRWRRHKQVN